MGGSIGTGGRVSHTQVFGAIAVWGGAALQLKQQCAAKRAVSVACTHAATSASCSCALLAAGERLHLDTELHMERMRMRMRCQRGRLTARVTGTPNSSPTPSIRQVVHLHGSQKQNGGNLWGRCRTSAGTHVRLHGATEDATCHRTSSTHQQPYLRPAAPRLHTQFAERVPAGRAKGRNIRSLIETGAMPGFGKPR